MSNVVSMTTTAARRLRPSGAASPRCRRHAGHPDIHEHDVRGELGGQAQRLLAVGGLAHHPRSGSISRIIRKPVRTSVWSSTIRSRIGASSGPGSCRLQRQRGHQLEPTCRPRPARRANRRRRRRAPACPAARCRARVRGRAAGRRAVVADGQLELVMAVGDRHVCAARAAGVPQGVGQSLLHDPVRREVQSRSELAGGARRPTPRPAARPRGTCPRAARAGPARAAAPARASPQPSSPRSTATIRRISARASRPTSSTVSRASRSTAWSGRSRRRTAHA